MSRDRRRDLRLMHARHPGLRTALVADARITSISRGDGGDFSTPLGAVAEIIRLAVVSDGFIGLVLYRVKAALQRRGIPLLPRIAHRLAMRSAQVCIGDPVVMAPGVYLIHGQTVIDGITTIGENVIIGPWTSIGLRAGDVWGPTIEPGANIGTGARVLGPVRIGAGAVIGANAVVLDDIPPGAVAVGVPARVVAQL